LKENHGPKNHQSLELYDSQTSSYV